MHDKFSRCIEAALAGLARRIERSSKKVEAAGPIAGSARIRLRNQRSAARFHIALPAAACSAGWRLRRARSCSRPGRHPRGCIPAANRRRNRGDEQPRERAIQFPAEAAFRIPKDQRFRPIWHHREDRVLAPIAVCFLACVRWSVPACASSARHRVRCNPRPDSAARRRTARRRPATLLDRLDIVPPTRVRTDDLGLPLTLTA